MGKGWIKLHRKVQDSPQWLKKPFGKGRAWVDLLMLANHAPGFIEVRGLRLPVNRGEIGWSQPELAKRFGWSRGKVKRFLNELEMDNQIVQQKNNVSTLITIVNYDKYQGNDTADDTADGQQTVLQTVPQTVPQTDPNNKNKEVKNEKEVKIYYTEEEGLVLPSKEKEHFKGAFKSKDVDAEIKKMSEWLYSNPTKRKKNYRRFVVGWLERAKDISEGDMFTPLPMEYSGAKRPNGGKV
jgi:hypothetical protein